MIDKGRALTLLGVGLGPAEVSTTLGCDPSYISQLLMDEDFRAQVLAKRVEHLQEATQRDENINKIEDSLIEKLKEHVPFLVKTQDILRAFAVLNAAKRRGAATSGAITLQQNIVQLTLPPAARRIFTTNHIGEVVQVDEQPTITMPLQTLLKDRITKLKGAANGQPQEAISASPTRENSVG